MIHRNLKTLTVIFIITCCNICLNSQSVGISDDGSSPEASAMLDVKSADKGLLIPRADTSAITSPATGLMLFQPSDNRFYYYNGTTWITFNGRLFDADNDTGIDVEQTTDDDKIRMFVEGDELLRLERNNYNVGRIQTQGFFNKSNIFIGFNAGLNTGQDSTFVNSGKFNTAVGDNAMEANTNGVANSAFGNFALYANTTGVNNTAVGWNSLGTNVSGDNNTALGNGSLDANSSGYNHTAIGLNALGNNIIGSNSIALGYRAGVFDTSSVENVYLGASAGAGGPTNSYKHNKTGNLMAGYRAGENNMGDYNVFLGHEAGQNQTGDHRLFIENSNADSTDALIYGEFDNDVLRFNGTVHIEESWSDLDGDTKIKLEETSDDDKIRMIVAGNELLRFERNSNNIGRMQMQGFENKNNVFVGYNAGLNTGQDSTFVNSGKFNTAVGDFAMQSNTNGVSNTAHGNFSLGANTTGSSNTAAGWNSLGSNSSGNNNSAFGSGALAGSTTGANNTAVGLNAMNSNSSGLSSVGIGYRAGAFDTASVFNVYLGGSAGAGGPTIASFHKKSNNVMIGYNSGENAQGDGNVFIGFKSGQNENGDNKLYIDNSNTTSPLIYGDFNTNLLRVNGDFNINNAYTFPSGDGGAGRVLTTNGSGTLSWQLDDNGYWSQNGSEIYFTNNVGVGINNPTKRFHAVDNIDGDYVARIDNQNQNVKAYGLEIEIGPNSNVTTTNAFIAFKDGNGTFIGSVTGDNSGGILFNTTSDKRLKQNITPYHNGITLLKDIETYSYEMKSNPGTEHIGFIAQELYKVMPQIVKGSPETTDIENPMMVDYSKMVPVLVAATKELIKENEALKSKIYKLETVQNNREVLAKKVEAQQLIIEELSQLIKTR
jgi:hypothetical protein